MAERKDYDAFWKGHKEGVDNFEAAFEAFANKVVPEAVLTLTKGIAQSIIKKVSNKSPVKTGLYRANWNTTIGTAADTSVTDDTDRDPEAEADKVLVNLKPYEAVTISNNVAYAGAIERGHSQKAPVGVLGITLDEVRVELEKGMKGSG